MSALDDAAAMEAAAQRLRPAAMDAATRRVRESLEDEGLIDAPAMVEDPEPVVRMTRERWDAMVEDRIGLAAALELEEGVTR
jgi:hypothetical protein